MRILAIITALFVSIAPLWAQDFEPTERTAVLERIADLIDDNYVYADKAAEIATEMRGWKDDPAVAAADNELIFASMLTQRLKAHDAHFSVSWSAPDEEEDSSTMSHGSDQSFEEQERLANYGFDAAQRLDGNVGYLRMNYFSHFDRDATATPPMRRAAEAAMAFLEETDAMIIDLRQNGGGSPAMVHLIFSHFVDAKPMLINKFYERQGDQMVEFYSFDKIANKRRPNAPVFVLTSARTGSAAEEFAYDIQTHKRGVIVGEASAGAANPGDTFDAGDGFSVFISTGAAVNPITGTNWEGVGVQPDIEIAANDAMTRAYALALEAVIDREKGSQSSVREAEWTLERLHAKAARKTTKRSVLRQYAGSYGSREIALRGDHLVYKRGRRPEQTLIALDNDLFALSETVTVRIRFERGPDGDVVAITLLDVSGSKSRYSRAGG